MSNFKVSTGSERTNPIRGNTMTEAKLLPMIIFVWGLRITLSKPELVVLVSLPTERAFVWKKLNHHRFSQMHSLTESTSGFR